MKKRYSTYDPTRQSVYIAIKQSKVSKTKELDPNIYIDYDSDGDVVGVEIISFEIFKAENNINDVMRRVKEELL